MRVLILDEGFVSGAITALGLRRAGCEVTVLAATGARGGCVAGTSRWEMGPAPADARLSAAIVARAAESDVVYPVTEPLQALAWSSGLRVFPSADRWQRELFASKRRMSGEVSDAGVAVPEEHDADDDGSVADGIRVLGLPVVVKGSRGRGGAMTVIAGSARDVFAAAARLRAKSPGIFLQRYVRGQTYLAGGVFEKGRALRLYLARKTVQFPDRTGPAAELQSVHDGALQEAALDAFAAARVSGIASADFVRDGRRGRFQFLELNPRPWGSMAAAAAAGVDLFGPIVSLWRGDHVVPRLTWRAGVRTATLPLYLLSPRMWLSGRALRAIPRDAARIARLATAEPSLAAHLARRCVYAVQLAHPDLEPHAPSRTYPRGHRGRRLLVEPISVDTGA